MVKTPIKNRDRVGNRLHNSLEKGVYMPKDCKCEFCIQCDCGHRADEHTAGEGHCFLCSCPEWTENGKTWRELAKEQEKEKLKELD